MELTSEQVEKVRQYAGVTYEEARAALMQTGGEALDAVLLLERQGKAKTAPGGSWSTRYGAPPQEEPPRAYTGMPAVHPKAKHRKYTSQEVGSALKNFFRNCTKISVDIWRGDDLLVGAPLVVCVLLFIVAYQIMIPLTIVGLILRCRYHISGWEGGTDDINRTMDRVTETVAELTDRAKAEWSRAHGKKK